MEQTDPVPHLRQRHGRQRLAGCAQREVVGTRALPPHAGTRRPRLARTRATSKGCRPVRNPKREVGRSADLYDYYAGYSTGFVEDAIAGYAGLRTTGLPIVDPWNGAGTTTSVAQRLDVPALGFDLNPVLTVVSKARLLAPDVLPSLRPLLEEILAVAAAHRNSGATAADDPLRWWFTLPTVSSVRAMTRAINSILIETSGQTAAPDTWSSLASYYYTLLFRAIRSFLGRFQTSNPTWIKRATVASERVAVSFDELAACMRALNTQWVVVASQEGLGFAADAGAVVTVATASSSALPLADGSCDAVIGSPPYLTRIDYVVATLPELSVLGLSRAEISELRRRMLGSPMTAGTVKLAETAPTSVSTLIEDIACHTSKASNTYYRACFTEYFNGMLRSLSELARVVRPGGGAWIVIQDSYYKNIHVDVARLLTDCAEAVGWSEVARHDFRTRTSMIHINSRARPAGVRKYPTESVLCWRRVA